jgi:hypothetical protein
MGEAGIGPTDAGPGGAKHRPGPELIPREFLRVLAVWSLIPSYLIAGAFLGYLVDTWLHLFPYITGLGLLLALLLAMRDMLRLRETM